jgi:hypothetical protein
MSGAFLIGAYLPVVASNIHRKDAHYALLSHAVAPAQMRVIGGRSLWLTGEGVYPR